MWTRGELKNQAKNAMGKNYWKLVLAGLIVSLMTGAFGSGFSQKFGENDKPQADGIL